MSVDTFCIVWIVAALGVFLLTLAKPRFTWLNLPMFIIGLMALVELFLSRV